MAMNFLLLLFLGMLIFHIVTRYSRKGLIVRRIPGPFAYPLIGNVPVFFFADLHQMWEIARKYSKQYYPITRYWALKSALISVQHPDDLKILFTSPKILDKGFMYDFFHPWLKTGLLTSTGKKWRHRRRILTPAFHFNILKKYLDIMTDQGEKFVNSLKNEGENFIKDLIPFCTEYTLHVICESAMGVSLDSIDSNIVEKYKKAIHEMGNIVVYRIPRPYLNNWMMNFSSWHRTTIKILHQFTEKILKDRKEYHQSFENKYLNEFMDNIEPTSTDNQSNNNKYKNIGQNKRRLAMLDLLLAAEQSGLIDLEGIKEEVDTFTFEAHDTTGMAMTFALMLLAENQEAQNLARIEVSQVYDKNNGELGINDFQELDYLERCIKETLRLFPSAATLLRYTSEEIQLKNALIPADSHIIIHLYDTHRDPNFWPNPEKFDPDRFLPERSRHRHPFAYLPFSAGPRNCIGQKFAMLELKSILSLILYDFHLEPVDRTTDMKLIADMILRPLNPVRIKMIRIKK